jgi:hypothetical protein
MVIAEEFGDWEDSSRRIDPLSTCLKIDTHLGNPLINSK